MGRRYLRTTVFDFLDYRAYLRAAFAEMKERRDGYSLRRFSSDSGFASAASMKLVLDGLRGLSETSARRVAEVLHMPKEEVEHFLLLIEYNDARAPEDRDFAFERLTAAARFRKLRPLDARQVDYHRRWYYAAVRELVGLDAFVENAAWIAANLEPQITEREAERAVRKLVKMGFLVRDDAGRLRQAQPVVVTDDEVAHQAVKRFHKQMIELGARAIDTQTAEERDVRAATVSISMHQAARIKKMAADFIRAALAVAVEPEPVEAVYELNVQWFRLSSAPGDPARAVGGGAARRLDGPDADDDDEDAADTDGDAGDDGDAS